MGKEIVVRLSDAQHAQLTAEGFYLKEGFTPLGDVFDEAGIAHRKMEKLL